MFFFDQSFDPGLSPPSSLSGDSHSVSRHHAILRWVPSTSSWELVVLSKNGVTVNGAHVPQTLGGADAPLGAGRALASRDVLSVGDEVRVQFLLPRPGSEVLVGGEVTTYGGVKAEAG